MRVALEITDYVGKLYETIFTVAIALWRVLDKAGFAGVLAVFSFFLLWLIPVIGYFIIGFGDARYQRV